MKDKILLFLLLGFFAAILFKGIWGDWIFKSKKEPQKTFEEIQALNKAKLEAMTEDIYEWMLHNEGSVLKPHFAGAWQIGPGLTLYSDGRKVKKTDKPITATTAKKHAIFHLENRVYPYICNNVKVELSEGQLLGACDLVYNVGGSAFAGYKDIPRSAFLKAINDGEDTYEAAAKLTGFRSSAGHLKRRWVAAALYCEVIDVKQAKELEPCKFYDEKDLSFFYKDGKVQEDGYYHPKFDEETVKLFLKKNKKASVQLARK